MRRRKIYVIAGAVMIVAAVAMTTIYMSQQQEKKLAKQESTEELDNSRDVAQQSTEEEVRDVGNVLEPKVKTIEEIKEEMASTEDNVAQATETAVIDGALADAGEEAGGGTDAEAGGQATDSQAETAAASAQTTDTHFSEESNVNWPLQGDVILNYSMDKTVYFATLDQYKYNPAVIIAGNVNDRVNHVADGTVTEVSTNETTGTTVTVDLGDGYSAVYGQLKSLMCKEGDTVKSGSAVGYISEPTKYYSVEGANLYFELLKDGEPVDPVGFFQ